MRNLLPYGRQWVDETDIAAVAGVLRSEFLTTGPAVAAFESALATQCQVQHAVVVSSGTAALHGAYFAAGLKRGDEIVTTPLTFAATANAALHLGASVRFADVSEDTGNLNPESVEPQLTSRTRLIVGVDFAGHPADYSALRNLAPEGVGLVADAAHSLGARLDGHTVGTLAHITTLSFHPVKLITTGEGGAVLSEDPDVASRVKSFRSHGISRRPEMEGERGPWFYEMEDLGFNFRMTDIQAALGSSQLQRLDQFMIRRRLIAERYNEAFASIDAIRLPAVRSGVAHAWHLYVVRVRGGTESRRRLFERLRSSGLAVQVHYIPVYWHPYYRELGYRLGQCPEAEAFYSQAISLPIFPKMTDSEIESVVDRVVRACAEVL